MVLKTDNYQALRVLPQTAGRGASRMSQWNVYIVECADGSLYTGIAKDVERRVSAHNTGQGAKYTRSRRPVTLVYRETATDRSAALRRELAIKQLRPAEKRSLVDSGHL